MGILNIHEVTSWIFWIFMKWRHGYLNFRKLTSLVIWMFMKWRHGILNIHEGTLWEFRIFMKWRHGYFEYSWSDVIGILNFHEVTRLEITSWAVREGRKISLPAGFNVDEIENGSRPREAGQYRMAAIPGKPVERSGPQTVAGQHIKPIVGKRRRKPNWEMLQSFHSTVLSGVGQVTNQP